MERISVKEAAKLMGCSQQFIRIGLQRGILPIGYAVKMRQWVYYVSRPMLEAFIGKKIPRAGTRETAENDSAERTI